MRSFPLLAFAAFALAACENNPAGLKKDRAVDNPFASLAAGGSSIPAAVTDAGKLIPHTLIPGFPDLTQTCTAAAEGTIVTGIAFDGTNIFVAHGGWVNSCIARYNAATGAYIDQRNFRPDARGLTWVPGLGKLVARTYGGPEGNQDNPAEIGRFFAIDYFAGTAVLLTNYDVQTCNSQGQPGVDQDGLGYWTNCGSSLEHRRMSDGAILSSVPVSPFFPQTNPVSTASGAVGLPSGAANQYAGYDRLTSGFVTNVSTVSSNGCVGYGVGVSADGSRIGVNLDCTDVRIETLDLASHGPLTAYPGTPVTGHIKLCKDASSPAGTYGFTISSSGTIAGDVVQSAALLTPGQCRIVFSRTAFSNHPVTLTITEIEGDGFTVHNITRTQFGTTTVFSGPAATITVQANSSHGGVVTYENIADGPVVLIRDRARRCGKGAPRGVLFCGLRTATELLAGAIR